MPAPVRCLVAVHVRGQHHVMVSSSNTRVEDLIPAHPDLQPAGMLELLAVRGWVPDGDVQGFLLTSSPAGHSLRVTRALDPAAPTDPCPAATPVSKTAAGRVPPHQTPAA